VELCEIHLLIYLTASPLWRLILCK